MTALLEIIVLLVELMFQKNGQNIKLSKGFSNGFGDISGKFRPGTKSVCPFIFCNYGQNEEAILYTKNNEIVFKDIPKFVKG